MREQIAENRCLMKRWPQIDALRGFMLVMMTITHVPTRFSGLLGQPFGFVSAAEGFVFLSAFMASLIFARRAADKGISAMLKSFIARAGKLYVCHVTMLAFLFTVIALVGISTDRQAIKNLISFYLREPVTAVASSLVLLYNPPLLDILPMYVVFMMISPLLLAAGLRWRWMPMMIVSLILWMGAQFGMAREIYEAMRDVTGITVPYHETGAFDLLAWQLIWFAGLWLGAQFAAERDLPIALPIVVIAIIVAAAGLIVRYAIGQAPFPEHKVIGLLLDKWRLGPLRVLNFLALVVIALRFAPLVKDFLRCRPLERLGVASLAVFCAHLISVLVILALLGDKTGKMRVVEELLLISGTLAVMFATAWAGRPRKPKAGVTIAKQQVAVSASGGR